MGAIPVIRDRDAYVNESVLVHLRSMSFSDIRKQPSFQPIVDSIAARLRTGADVLIDDETTDTEGSWLHPDLYRALSDEAQAIVVLSEAKRADTDGNELKLRVRPSDRFINASTLLKIFQKTRFSDVRQLAFFTPTVEAMAKSLGVSPSSLIDSRVRSEGVWLHPDLHAALLGARQAQQSQPRAIAEGAAAAVDAFRGTKRPSTELTVASPAELERVEYAVKLEEAKMRLLDARKRAINIDFQTTVDGYELIMKRMAGTPYMDEGMKRQMDALMANAAARATSELKSFGVASATAPLIEAPSPKPSMTIAEHLAARGIHVNARAALGIGAEVAKRIKTQFPGRTIEKQMRAAPDGSMRPTNVYTDEVAPIIVDAHAWYNT